MNYIEIPKTYIETLGELDQGTRIFRTSGTDKDYRKWFKAILKITDGRIVSPGGVAMYCRVTRAGFHKKIKTGGLTAFCFHFEKYEKSMISLKETKKIEQKAYMFIPIYELEQWEEELLTKKEMRKYNNEDFMNIPRKHKLVKGKKIAKYDLG